MSYDDGATPSLAYTFTRRGQQENVTQGTNSWKLFYTLGGELLSEAWTGGMLNGVAVTNAFDAFLRRTNIATFNQSTQLTAHGYSFNAAGRLDTASDGSYTAQYSYLANSPLVSQITFRSNSTVRMTTTKQYDLLNRLSAIANLPSADSALSFDYAYNPANQRTQMRLADGSYWTYKYDSLGQVISGKRYWSDGTPIPGQQFEYAFDQIGNRTSTKAGGDQNGANLRSANYTNNSLNQITSRDVPGTVDIIGSATAIATNVNVNDVMAYRRGEYYQVGLSVGNTSAAQWQSVTNRAVQSGTTNSIAGNVFLAQTSEVFGYDADGNQTNDGRWMLSWDAENHLVQVESQTSAPSASKRKVTYSYDWRGRLVRRTEYNGSSGNYVITNDLKMLADGWHCLAELNATNNALVRSYLWGLDLRGSMTRAGGVGGILEMNGLAKGIHFYAFDGNGNTVSLVQAADGKVSASYEYDPFGQVVRRTGDLAGENPYGFSTKRTDSASDLGQFPFRVYRSSVARWLGRDPLDEAGGANPYCLLGNDPVDLLDPLGLYNLQFDIGDNFTDSQQTRVSVLIDMTGATAKAISDELVALIPRMQNAHPCCPGIAKQLIDLKKVMDRIVAGVNSKTENLEVEQHRLSSDRIAVTETSSIPFWDPKLQLNTKPGFDWTLKRSTDLLDDFLHELSHIYGTEDDDSLGELLNAYAIELYTLGVEHSSAFQGLLLKCPKLKKPTKLIPTH